MRYPDAFKARVKEAFPDRPDIAEYLEEGAGNIVGKILSDFAVHPFRPDEILSVAENQPTRDEIVARAVRAEQAGVLFQEWRTLKERQAGPQERS